MPESFETLTRRATLGPSSLDAEAGTVDATISTFAPVQRKGFVERLDPAGLDSSRLIGAPVLDGHRQGSARDVIGVVESVRVDGEALVATIRLSGAADVASTVQKIREGTIRGVSVGYVVTRWIESTDQQTRQRVKTAAAWTIREVSAVAVPADPGATFRSDQMPKDTQDTDREGLIARVRSALNLPEEWATRMAEAGEEITDDEIRASGREEAATIRATRTTPIIRTAAPANDDPAVTMTRRADALACRASGEAPSEEARLYMADTIRDHARACVEASGVSTRGMDPDTLFRAAMHGTSDFPELLNGVGRRSLLTSYKAAESPLKRLAKAGSRPDFRTGSTLRLGEIGPLQKVSEAGEIKHTTRSEAKESWALDTYGSLFSISRKALINDDLGAFNDWAFAAGQAAAQTETAVLWGLLAQSSYAGPVMGDGKKLFHADHGNLLTPAALSVTSLSLARVALRGMKGLDGKTLISVSPKYLLVGPANETLAEQLLTSINATTVAEANPFSGKLTLLVDPNLSGNAWYLFADPVSLPVLEHGYLSSAPGPQMSSREGWDTLSVEYRVVLDYGAGALDWRGAVRNAGA